MFLFVTHSITQCRFLPQQNLLSNFTAMDIGNYQIGTVVLENASIFIFLAVFIIVDAQQCKLSVSDLVLSIISDRGATMGG